MEREPVENRVGYEAQLFDVEGISAELDGWAAMAEKLIEANVHIAEPQYTQLLVEAGLGRGQVDKTAEYGEALRRTMYKFDEVGDDVGLSDLAHLIEGGRQAVRLAEQVPLTGIDIPDVVGVQLDYRQRLAQLIDDIESNPETDLSQCTEHIERYTTLAKEAPTVRDVGLYLGLAYLEQTGDYSVERITSVLEKSAFLRDVIEYSTGSEHDDILEVVRKSPKLRGLLTHTLMIRDETGRYEIGSKKPTQARFLRTTAADELTYELGQRAYSYGRAFISARSIEDTLLVVDDSLKRVQKQLAERVFNALATVSNAAGVTIIDNFPQLYYGEEAHDIAIEATAKQLSDEWYELARQSRKELQRQLGYFIAETEGVTLVDPIGTPLHDAYLERLKSESDGHLQDRIHEQEMALEEARAELEQLYYAWSSSKKELKSSAEGKEILRLIKRGELLVTRDLSDVQASGLAGLVLRLGEKIDIHVDNSPVLDELAAASRREAELAEILELDDKETFLELGVQWLFDHAYELQSGSNPRAVIVSAIAFSRYELPASE